MESAAPSLMAFVNLPGVAHTLLMTSMRWDGLIFDLQHGVVTPSQAGDAITVAAGAGVAAWVRLPANDAGLIGQMLDAGSIGILCPLVESRRDAEALVSACRYPPEGHRSMGALRANLLYGPRTTTDANRFVRAFAIVESARGMANLDEIIQTPGLCGIVLGIADLAISEGRQFIGYEDLLTRQSAERAASAARAAGRMFGLPLIPGRDPSFVYGLRPDLMIVGSDVDFLLQAGNAAIEKIGREIVSGDEPTLGTH